MLITLEPSQSCVRCETFLFENQKPDAEKNMTDSTNDLYIFLLLKVSSFLITYLFVNYYVLKHMEFKINISLTMTFDG